ncbi:MAG: response regulator [Acidobacteriota bacterium]
MQRKKFWVLIVEDDVVQTTFCTKYLRRFEDRFDIAVALDGRSAIQLLTDKITEGFNDRQPVILLDYYLPDGTGEELLPKLLHLLPECVIIVVTAYEAPEMSSNVLNAGAIDYIYKTPDYYKHLPRVIEVACDRWVIRRELEQALERARQHEAELAVALRQLEHTQMQLVQSEKMLAIRQLISGMSHELNNSLTSVIGFAQLLLSERVGDSNERALRIIAQEAEHAHRIIDKLLAFGRQQKPECRWLDINRLLERVVDIRSYQLKVSNIEVKFDLQSQIPLIYADEHQLQQAFLNLIVNAEGVLLMAELPKQIEIKSWVSNDRLCVSIKDNGPGIPADAIAKVFDPFFTTKPLGEGIGLGLSVCYGIMQEHNGTIEVTNDQGACFTVTLPISRQAELSKTVKSTKQARLLVVDDELPIRLLLTEWLEKEGYQVDAASNGKEALEKFIQTNTHYDAFIVDCKMPVMDGIEFYRALKAIDANAADRVIFATGDTVAGKTLGFLRDFDNMHIVKPFDIKKILEVLQLLLDAKNRAGA